MNLVLSEAADADLEGIGRYTVERWGREQAIISLRGLLLRLEAIADSPWIATDVTVARRTYRRWSYRSHTFYATQASDRVTVVRILHGRMDLARHLR